LPAVILSAACFSIYHLGYSFVRGNIDELPTLFWIGIFFSISFRITGSIVTSYVVNLPHAILTFIADPGYASSLSRFTAASAVVSLATVAAGLALIAFMDIATSKPA
ncbi:MAG: CPBP family glutamic-type intramembrane protease, partial [Roseiarcus sp.]